jgi:cold shock CspA family protein
MRQTGTLRTWNDDRGFGFIAPTQGGRELFVHASAFPPDGSRPTVGELLSYDLGRGPKGQPQAVRVVRQALGEPRSYPAPPRRGSRREAQSKSQTSVVGTILVALMVAGLGGYGWKAWQERAQRTELAQRDPAPLATLPAPVTATFQCDGRVHCSQMTSCAEATYFIQHCPGTQMDGDNDGVPCEQQWCTSPFAK